MKPRHIAVIGSGISGLSAAWLLSQKHRVTLIEADNRPGGHSNTVDCDIDGRDVAVDTGFIVYNPPAYPNLTALFDHLGVPTAPSNMSSVHRNMMIRFRLVTNPIRPMAKSPADTNR